MAECQAAGHCEEKLTLEAKVEGQSRELEVVQGQVDVLRKENSRLRRAQGHGVDRLGSAELSELEAELLEALGRVRAAKERAAMAESLEEVPEEYLDPIMHTVMEDPVRLPTSGKVVDREVIHRILASEARDPFSRAEVTIDQLEEQPDLKREIARWLASRGWNRSPSCGSCTCPPLQHQSYRCQCCRDKRASTSEEE